MERFSYVLEHEAALCLLARRAVSFAASEQHVVPELPFTDHWRMNSRDLLEERTARTHTAGDPDMIHIYACSSPAAWARARRRRSQARWWHWRAPRLRACLAGSLPGASSKREETCTRPRPAGDDFGRMNGDYAWNLHAAGTGVSSYMCCMFFTCAAVAVQASDHPPPATPCSQYACTRVGSATPHR